MDAKPVITVRSRILMMSCVAILLPWYSAQGETYSISDADSPDSFFLVATDTAGLLGFAGHRHAILAESWRAELFVDPQNLAASRISISVNTDTMILDSERAYQLAGFEKAIPPEDARLATMARIRGPDVLNVEFNPLIKFESEETIIVSTDSDGNSVLSVTGGLQLRGDILPPAPITFDTAMEQRPGRIVFEGTIEIRQSDFGIKPFSMAGVMRVRDQIRLIWRLVVNTESL